MSSFDTRSLPRINASSLRNYGEPITYTPTVGDPVTVSGVRSRPITDEGYSPGQNTIYWVREADFVVRPVPGGTVTIGATVYTVAQVQNDGGLGLNLVMVKA